jgi:WD40 repeat protein
VRVMPHQGENEHEFVFSERKTRKARLPTELEVLPLRTSPHRTKSGETTVSTKEQESDISSKEEERKDTKTSSLPIRNEDEACKVPTRLYSRFEGGSLGNTALTFTPDGDRVVVACVETTHCPIRVFDIHTKTLCLELTGHTGIVHQLSWFPFQDKKTMLCSASSDGTVMVWNLSPSSVKKRNSIGPTFILPHPNATFVYTVAIRPMSSRRREDEDLVCVSGAYDQELRLWSLTKGTLCVFIFRKSLRMPNAQTHRYTSRKYSKS